MNYFYDMSKRQAEIRDLLEQTDITQAWLARKLGITPQKVNYHLAEAAELDYDLYNEMKKVLVPLTGHGERLTYIPISEAEKNGKDLIKYKIFGRVPAGLAEVEEYPDWQESDDLYYDPRSHFYLQVDEEFGFSMMPLINPGDKVLISIDAKVKDGDLVAARWDGTKGALKIYKENPDIKDIIVLTSYNQAFEPLFLKKKDVKLFKVVLIKKKR